MTFADAVAGYEADPSPATLRELRAQILAAPNYDPNLNPDRSTRVARAADDPRAVVDILEDSMPGAFGSPKTHGLLTEAYAQLGDLLASQRQNRLTKLAFRAILDTGDGSEEHPWTVIRIGDEYDVLQLMQRRSVTQDVEVRGGRRYDVHHHPDGSTTWFDATAIPTPLPG